MKEFPSTAVLPPTPPATPQGRGCSESNRSTPGLDKILQMSRDMHQALSGCAQTLDDHEHRVCGKLLSDSILWQVSGHVGAQWRHLGRILNVKEVDLMCIEFSGKGPQDQAYRALCRWRDQVVEKPTYGMLYTALCHPDINLCMIANRYCTTDGAGVA